MGIPLQIATFTGRYQRMLRRFTYSTARDVPECPGWKYGHDAHVIIGEADEQDHEQVHGDNWPHDDERWPAACERCGYEFAVSDQWQRNDNRIYRLPDGTEFAQWGAWGKVAPPGTMIRADWYDSFSHHPDGIESWLVALPDGGEWISSQQASGGGYWTVTGTPPMITVTPSIWHNSPHGWHGFITSGELTGA